MRQAADLFVLTVAQEVKSLPEFKKQKNKKLRCACVNLLNIDVTVGMVHTVVLVSNKHSFQNLNILITT